MENQKYQQLIEFSLSDRHPSHLTARVKQSYGSRAKRDYSYEDENLLRQGKIVLPAEVAFATLGNYTRVTTTLSGASCCN